MDLATRCDAIEECYEFTLAYAAQGVVDRMRTFLTDLFLIDEILKTRAGNPVHRT